MSLAVDIADIDVALRSHYEGLSVDVGGTPTSVIVFIEEPSSEITKERIFPSITIKLLGVVPDFEVSESDDEDQEETDYDDVPVVHERVMRQKPLPYRIQYSIDTWHKVRVEESRDLLRLAVVKKTPPRGYITVPNIDSDNVNLWMLQQGSVVQRDELEPDMVIYHKILTVNVLAYLSSVDFDDTVREKVVMTANWEAFSRLMITKDTGNEIVPGKDVSDIEFEFDSTTEGPV